MSNKMDPEVKERWLAALRSGDYSQGKQYLRSSENGFCCLGVLYDIEKPMQWCRLSDGGWYIENGRIGTLSNEFADKVGLGGLDSGGHSVLAMLSNMNDRGTTFPEIADWIEKNL